MEILCFFAGIVFVYTKSYFAILLPITALFFNARLQIIFWFIAAVCWASLHSWWVSDQGMPQSLVISTATVLGKIVSLPMVNPMRTQFQLAAARLNNQPIQANLLLACYQHCPHFNPGEFWQLQVKLKRPRNLANPGAFDYKSGLAAQHINWTGYIKSGGNKCLASAASSQLLHFRQYLGHSLAKFLPEQKTLGIAEALTLGLTGNIDKSQWDLFRRTGTTHLMVISGSHIALAAGISYWLVQWLWSLSNRLCLYRPASFYAAIAGILMALAYTLLAGFAVPAQRSLVACILLLLPQLVSKSYTGWQTWRYGLLLVLIWEPHAVLLPGFYLSFMAVAILIAVSQRFNYRGIKNALCLQAACLIGLMPFTLYWFSYGALTGLLANLLAIPLVGYIIVPGALLGLFAIQIVSLPSLLVPLHWVIKALLVYLQFIDKAAAINFDFPLAGSSAMLALTLAIIILVFIPLKYYLFPALILLIGALLPAHPRPPENAARLDILDVGQGLAIVVTTAHHTLIYDTGMQFFQGSDMGQMAIIPYLKSRGINKIDKVVISHPDIDHRGGLVSIEKTYSIGELIVNDVNFYHRGINCHQYPPWQWNGITFRFFPINYPFINKNNTSCVLMISNAHNQVLLTGDIEKPAEDYLVKTYAHALAANALIIAHHGSKTSTSVNFVKAVAPQYAIISAGFDNRYHFPHWQTLTTLRRYHAKIYNTVDCGMVTIDMPANAPMKHPSCYTAGNR